MTRALTVSHAEEVAWDDVADVVVVGFGAAGASAAIEARELGASVIVTDRFGGGGSTAFSGGVVYAGGGTQYQRESGFEDSPENMYRYLEAENCPVSPETLRRFCDGSKDDLEWLERHGVPHGSNAYPEKTTFPPDPHWLYFSGNETMPHYSERATPAPRGHRTVAPGFLNGGKVLFGELQTAALRLGITLRQHSPVTRLVTDADGRILGVELNELPQGVWNKHNALYRKVHPYLPFNSGRAEKAVAAARMLERRTYAPRYIRATGGVVLATGGFIYNLPMLWRHRPELAVHHRSLLRFGSLAEDGSGIELGESVGGVTDSMDHVAVGRSVSPPLNFSHGLMVNSTGKRFINEAAYAVNTGMAILDQPNEAAWLLLEARDFWTGVRRSLFPGRSMFIAWGLPPLANAALGGTRRAATLEDLACKIKIHPAVLSDEVRQFNALVDTGSPDPLGKSDKLMHPLREGPFYALNMSIANRFCPAMVFTLGGLVLDEDTGAVVRADGWPIPGLYAAGRVGVGLCSNGYVSGLSIADSVFGGRRAARAIAQAGSTST